MQVLELSNHTTGVGYTRRADEALAEDWGALAAALDAMLSNLSAAAPGEWVVFASPLEGVDRLNQPAHLLGMWFSGPSDQLTDSDWFAAAEPFREGWTYEGQQTLDQGTPFPVRAALGGVPHALLLPGEEPDGRVISLSLGQAGEASFVAAAADGSPVVSAVRSAPPPAETPTSAHLLTLVVYQAAVALVSVGLPAADVMRQFEMDASPRLIRDLGELPDRPSALAGALVPYLASPADYLDDQERQVAMNACLRLLRSAGEPSEAGLGVARRFAASLGVELDL